MKPTDRHRRNQGSAASVVEPLSPSFCLAWIGLLHLTRGTAVRHVRGVGADGAPISISEPHFLPLVATMVTGAWLAPGNRVEVMLNGDET